MCVLGFEREGEGKGKGKIWGLGGRGVPTWCSKVRNALDVPKLRTLARGAHLLPCSHSPL